MPIEMLLFIAFIIIFTIFIVKVVKEIIDGIIYDIKKGTYKDMFK